MSRKSIAELSLLAAIMGGDFSGGMPMRKPVTYVDKRPPVPKGCKEYFFNAQGEFSTTSMRKDECVFKCAALNDKNAKKKFENYKKEIDAKRRLRD